MKKKGYCQIPRPDWSNLGENHGEEVEGGKEYKNYRNEKRTNTAENIFGRERKRAAVRQQSMEEQEFLT